MATRLVQLNQSDESPHVHEFGLGRVVALARGWDTPDRENQDCLLVREIGPSIVLAVADGAGGGPTGGKASRLAIEALDRKLDEPHESVRAAILDAFEAANQALLEVGTGLATTLSIVELRPGPDTVLMRSYHVGDSSVLVTGGRGKLKLNTVSHSPVGYGVEAGLISEKEALHHEDLNIVSNMVGMSNMRIEVSSEVRLAQRDTLVLASDGLFDNLHAKEVIEMVRKGDLTGNMNRLRKKTLARMTGDESGEPSKPDDLSVILFRPFGRRAKRESPQSQSSSSK